MRRAQVSLIVVCCLLAGIATTLAAMIAFGGGEPPKPLASIGEPFKAVDFSALPAEETVAASHGSPIAFRHWDAADAGSPAAVVIAVHGSSASSTSLHPLAQALSAKGFTVYAPDIRGHGETGTRGDIDYDAQLDDDMADFVAAVKKRHPEAPLALIGFSSGGGFALHIAATPLGAAFTRVVLLSPYLGPRAPTIRQEGTNAWAKVFLPRLLALALLDRAGVHAFEHMPVLAFGVLPEQAKFLTTTYSFVLTKAFGTEDYVADLRHAKSPVAVVVGGNDELFDASRFADAIHAVRVDIPVTVVPGLNHIGLTLDVRAVPAIVSALRGAAGA
jgi:alpha-beta hydrolase superfamily lysophospholipase